MQTGVLAGFPVVDIKVTLYDGSFHEVDSSEMAFKIAGSMGLKDGVSVLDSRIFVYYYRSTPDGRLMLGKGGNTFAWRGRIAPGSTPMSVPSPPSPAGCSAMRSAPCFMTRWGIG